MSLICLDGSASHIAKAFSLTSHLVARRAAPFPGYASAVKSYRLEFRDRRQVLGFLKSLPKERRSGFARAIAPMLNTARFFANNGPAKRWGVTTGGRLRELVGTVAKDFPRPALFLALVWQSGDLSDTSARHALKQARALLGEPWAEIPEAFHSAAAPHSSRYWREVAEDMDKAVAAYSGAWGHWRTGSIVVFRGQSEGGSRSVETPNVLDDARTLQWAFSKAEFSSEEVEKFIDGLSDYDLGTINFYVLREVGHFEAMRRLIRGLVGKLAEMEAAGVLPNSARE